MAVTMSRQRKYQKRMAAEGRCVLCGKPRDGNATHCERHRVQRNKREQLYRRCSEE